MASDVFFIDMRASIKRTRLEKIGDLIERVKWEATLPKKSLVAVKIHFGEKGNTSYIHPVYVRKIVDKIKSWNFKPFLTDANTLYVGSRANSVDHMITAIENGFDFSVVGAPVLIADGIRGASEVAVTIDQEIYERVYIGTEIVNADAIVSLAHFKAHELSGFGGTIKNLGMGCASRRGKMAQHSEVSPKVNKKKCIGCGTCSIHCPADAIRVSDEDGKAATFDDLCIGCGSCLVVCPQNALEIRWDTDGVKFQKKMVEYTLGVLKGKEDRALYVNFVINVTPECDCYHYSDVPVVNDIGILASNDPVAIDQAAYDLVNQQPGRADSRLKKGHEPGANKFRALYPKIDPEVQLEYAEKLGLGSRKYNLVKVK